MRRFALIILLILSLLPVFACGGEPPPSPAAARMLQVKARITEVVTDEERQAQMLELADRMEKHVKKLAGLTGSTRNKVFKTYRKKDATPESLEKIFRRHSDKRIKAVSELVALRIEMRQLVTPEEWSRLVEGQEFVR